MVEIVLLVHLPDRRLGFFFSGHNNDCAPARQTTRTFFSGRNNDCAPARQTTRTFFSGRNNESILFPIWKKGSSSPRKAWAGSSSPREVSVPARLGLICSSVHHSVRP